MNTYLLSFPNVDVLKIEALIDEHLCGIQMMDNAFQPITDVFIFRSKLEISEIESSLISVVPFDEPGELEPWILVKISEARFGDNFKRGTLSRLEAFFKK